VEGKEEKKMDGNSREEKCFVFFLNLSTSSNDYRII